MNGKRSWLVVRAALMLLLGFDGCLEQSVKTIVSEDGSCERNIALIGLSVVFTTLNL